MRHLVCPIDEYTYLYNGCIWNTQRLYKRPISLLGTGTDQAHPKELAQLFFSLYGNVFCCFTCLKIPQKKKKILYWRKYDLVNQNSIIKIRIQWAYCGLCWFHIIRAPLKKKREKKKGIVWYGMKPLEPHIFQAL